ncbi:hypothetical protein O181_005880 [Austropuccinia psidii MF-1]|uniref:Reverse transcriptase Ty1/copia-type domain-containing protein n=1 Tax=Austropuccinia psidii MF-1 TaxID=1389203 RepID=A0A9Q3GGA2_9BASI|nr:hypothetical protein [Austropuccinia psidii MF-1]
MQDSFALELNSLDGLSSTLMMSYKEAMSSTQEDLWKQDIMERLDSMTKQEVLINTNLQEALKEVPQESILSTKWVFAKKKKPKQYKGLLVAQGFRQIHGINFDERFAPTPKFSALRMLFSITCKPKWMVNIFEIKVAFLHSLIDKPVYLWPPKGMHIPQYHVLKLKEALYFTKQAACC